MFHYRSQSRSRLRSPRGSNSLTSSLFTTILTSSLALIPAAFVPVSQAQNKPIAAFVPVAQDQGKPIAALTPGLLNIIAGTGANGYTGDNGPATAATFNDSFGVAVDFSGNVFIADSNNQVVRKVNASTGIVTTFAGTGVQGHTGDGGPALQAEFNGPDGLAFDAVGNLYVSELSGVVRKITPAGIISTVAGVYSGPGGFYGDNGPATAAGLNRPYSVYVDPAGNLYIGDTGNNVIRRVDAISGIITTVAGNGYGSNGPDNDHCGAAGFNNLGGYTGDGGPATSAELYGPRSVAIDAAGDLYIADTCNNVVRKVTASSGIITTVAGNGFGAGGAPGTGGFSGDGIKATTSELNFPEHILLDPAGDLYIADTENFRIRFVRTDQIIDTIAGNGTSTAPTSNVVATATGMHLESIAFDSAYNLYIDDAPDNQVLKIDVSQSAIKFPTPTIPGTFDSTDGYKYIALMNIGDSPLLNEGSQTTPASFSSFGVERDCRVLQPGAICAAVVAFNPLIDQSGPVSGTTTITDNSQLVTSTQTIHLTATAISSPEFDLTYKPSLLVFPRGAADSLLLTVTPANGFTGTVNFTASNLPPDGSLEFTPATLTLPGTASTAALLRVPSSTPIGFYRITITARSGSITNSVTVPVVVF